MGHESPIDYLELKRSLLGTVKQMDVLMASAARSEASELRKECQMIGDEIQTRKDELRKLKKERDRLHQVIQMQIEWCKGKGIELSWIEAAA